MEDHLIDRDKSMWLHVLMKLELLFLWNDFLDKQVEMEGGFRGKVLILFRCVHLEGLGQFVRMGWESSVAMILRLIDGRLM